MLKRLRVNYDCCQHEPSGYVVKSGCGNCNCTHPSRQQVSLGQYPRENWKSRYAHCHSDKNCESDTRYTAIKDGRVEVNCERETKQKRAEHAADANNRSDFFLQPKRGRVEA